ADDRSVIFAPGDSPTTSLLPDKLGRASEGDPIPDRSGFLVHRDHFGDGLPYSMIIDTTGSIQVVLDGWAQEDSSHTPLGLFAACSVTGDGKWRVFMKLIATKTSARPWSTWSTPRVSFEFPSRMLHTALGPSVRWWVTTWPWTSSKGALKSDIS